MGDSMSKQTGGKPKQGAASTKGSSTASSHSGSDKDKDVRGPSKGPGKS